MATNSIPPLATLISILITIIINHHSVICAFQSPAEDLPYETNQCMTASLGKFCFGGKNNVMSYPGGTGCFLTSDCDVILFAERTNLRERIVWNIFRAGNPSDNGYVSFYLSKSPIAPAPDSLEYPRDTMAIRYDNGTHAAAHVWLSSDVTFTHIQDSKDEHYHYVNVWSNGKDNQNLPYTQAKFESFGDVLKYVNPKVANDVIYDVNLINDNLYPYLIQRVVNDTYRNFLQLPHPIKIFEAKSVTTGGGITVEPPTRNTNAATKSTTTLPPTTPTNSKTTTLSPLNNNSTAKPKKHENSIVWIVLGVILVLLLIGGLVFVYFFTQSKKKKRVPKTFKPLEVRSVVGDQRSTLSAMANSGSENADTRSVFKSNISRSTSKASDLRSNYGSSKKPDNL